MLILFQSLIIFLHARKSSRIDESQLNCIVESGLKMRSVLKMHMDPILRQNYSII